MTIFINGYMNLYLDFFGPSSGLRALSHHVGSLPKKEQSFVLDGKQCNNPVQTYARSAGTTKTLIIEKRKNHLNDPMRRAMTYYEVLCVIVRSFD